MALEILWYRLLPLQIARRSHPPTGQVCPKSAPLALPVESSPISPFTHSTTDLQIASPRADALRKGKNILSGNFAIFMRY